MNAASGMLSRGLHRLPIDARNFTINGKTIWLAVCGVAVWPTGQTDPLWPCCCVCWPDGYPGLAPPQVPAQRA